MGGGCSCVLGKVSRRCCVWCSGIRSGKERARQAQACDVHLWLALNNKTCTLIRKANKETNKGECNKNSLRLVGMKRIGITTSNDDLPDKSEDPVPPFSSHLRSPFEERQETWVWAKGCKGVGVRAYKMCACVGLLTVAACCVRRPRRVQRSSAVRMLGGVAATWRAWVPHSLRRSL